MIENIVTDILFVNIHERKYKTQKYIVRLSIDERKTLFTLIEKGTASKEKQNRARILLKADSGEEGFEETLNRKMPPAGTRKRIIQGEEEAYLIAITCNEPPDGHARWTLSLLADKMIECKYVDTISPDAIGRALKKTNLNFGKKMKR